MPEQTDLLAQMQSMIQNTINNSNEKLKQELALSFEQTIDKKLEGIQKDITTLLNDVEGLKRTANDAYEMAKKNEEQLLLLQPKVKQFQEFMAAQDQLKAELVTSKQTVTNLEDELDDLRNRGMRGNLVFFGLPEEEDTKQHHYTKDIVAQFIFQQLYTEHDNISLEYIQNTIVRAHRSKFDPRRDAEKGPRPVFVKFYRDDLADKFFQQGIKSKVSQRGYQVKQQFTKKMQKRVDAALIHRKELFGNKAIVKGYVEYPAVLKGIYTGTTEWKVIRKF